MDRAAPAVPHNRSLEADGAILFDLFCDENDPSIPGTLPLNTTIKTAWNQHANCLPFMVPTADQQHIGVLIPRLDFVKYAPPRNQEKAVTSSIPDPSIDSPDAYLHPKYPPWEWSVYNVTAHSIIETMLPLDADQDGHDHLRALAKQLVIFGLRSGEHAKFAPLLGRALVHTLGNWTSIRRLDEDDRWSTMAALFKKAMGEHTITMFTDFWRIVSTNVVPIITLLCG